MNVGHPDTQIRCRTHRMGHRIRDIVEFQIEENVEASFL